MNSVKCIVEDELRQSIIQAAPWVDASKLEGWLTKVASQVQYRVERGEDPLWKMLTALDAEGYEYEYQTKRNATEARPSVRYIEDTAETAYKVIRTSDSWDIRIYDRRGDMFAVLSMVDGASPSGALLASHRDPHVATLIRAVGQTWES